MTSPDPEFLSRGGLRLETAGAVATVWLDRPERRNAQTPSMWQAMEHLGATLPDETRVVVLRGAGQSFSAGLDVRLIDGTGIEGEGDIPGLTALGDAEIDEWIQRCQAGFTWLRHPRLISIAVVHGHAYGAGFQLALSCDFRIATPGALFCMKETALGLVPDLTGTKPLVELVGYSRALDIIATARVVQAGEAFAMGLANILVDDSELEEALGDVTAGFTGPAHGAVVGAKQLALAAAQHDLDSQRALERTIQIGRLRELGGG